MNSTIVNNEITVSYSDGFEIMSSEELDNAYVGVTDDKWGIWDKDNHVIITLLWQKANPMLVALADVKAIAMKNESMAAKMYKNNHYDGKGFFSETIDGKKAEGYWFEYDVASVRQQAASVLFKNRNNIYSLSVFARADDPDFEDILHQAVRSVRIK